MTSPSIPVCTPPASSLHASSRAAPRWRLAELSGRLVELAGWRSGAVYSFALELVVDAQRSGETTVWVGRRSRSFFPADAQECGVDLGALPVVRLETAREMSVAADVLARSGAFGLIVVDLGGSRLERESVAMNVLARLAGLARKHETAIVLVTEKSPDAPSLGSVVSFRADASFVRKSDGLFLCELAVPRDRLHPETWKQVEVRRGPSGLS